MRRARAFLIRLAGLFRKARSERELAAEFESHLQMHIEDNLRAGMSAEEARRQALLKFGGFESTKETMRDGGTVIWMETAWQDVHYALRGFRRNPAFAATAILSLTLGLGASLAILTVTDNLLLRPLPYRDASELMMMWEMNTRGEGMGDHNVVSPGNYFAWKNQTNVFQSMAGLITAPSVLADGSRVQELGAQYMTADLLPMLGVKPIRGRLFTEKEARPGFDSVVLISYTVWQSWFGGDENIIGRNVQVSSKPYTIIGIMPRGFYFRDRETDLWAPLGLDASENILANQGRWMLCVGRMKPGVSRAQAQAQMTAIAQRLAAAYPTFDKNWTIHVESLRDSLVREVKPSLLVLLGAVGLLLAVACANLANLLFARYTSRRRELAVRASLGAGQWRVIRQLLTESMILALGGGALGMLLAKWALKGLLALAPQDLTQSAEIVVDLRIYLFAMALCAATGIIFGLVPALTSSRARLSQALHDDSRSSIGRSGDVRSWFVGAEVALSVILLAGALLLFRSLIGLQSVEPGLNPSNLLTFRVSLPRARYPDPQSIQFFSRAIERLQQLPGVRSASAVSYLPFTPDVAGTKFDIEGRPPARSGEDLVASIRTVIPGYFRTMGTPLKSGRLFSAADHSQTSPYRFIVNEAFVRKYFSGEQPLGKRISVDMDVKNPFGEIIGVTGDVKEGALDKEPSPTIYYIHAHLAYTAMIFLLRTESNPLGLAEPARRVIRGIDPAQPVTDVRTMDEVVRKTFSRQRFSMILLSGFSGASLLLAGIGIYGVLAYSVSERTREIGLRVALGAEPGRIISLVIRAAVRLFVGGAIIGTAGAIALSGFLKSMLFGIRRHDPLTFVEVLLILAGIALIAAYLPARRAAHLDPMDALRMD